MDKFTAGRAGLEARVVDKSDRAVVDNLWISVPVPLAGVGWLAGLAVRAGGWAGGWWAVVCMAGWLT